jgi:hypothetical protein
LASASWSAREIFQVFAICSQCSPIERPVRGSSTPGITGLKCPGRIDRNGAIRWPSDLPRYARSSSCWYARGYTTGGSLTVSKPPAMPLSI